MAIVHVGCNGCEAESRVEAPTEEAGVVVVRGRDWMLDLGVWWCPLCGERTHEDRMEILQKRRSRA